MVTVTSGNEFVNAWNNMDNYGEIDNVFLYLHGAESVLYFYDESFNLSDFKKLEYQEINNEVYNYSCKGAAGHTRGKSVIDALATKTNAKVTGNVFGVSYDESNGRYKARTQRLNLNRILHLFTFQPTWITVKKINIFMQIKDITNIIKNTINY